MPEDNVLDQFSKEFNETNVQDEFSPPNQQQAPASADDLDEDGEPKIHKNRRHRRLESENQRLREEAIALGVKVQMLSEAQKFAQEVKESNPDVDPDLIKLYGDHQLPAAKLTQSILEKVVVRAKAEAKEEMQAMMDQGETVLQKERENVSSALEDIEDRFNVDLSGDTDQSKNLRNGFITFVEKLSPKDGDGNIVDYADFNSAWEEYAARMNSVSGSRNKDLASRGMVRSGSTTTKAEDIAAQKYLRDAGII